MVFYVLADVDISKNPNTSNFWAAEYEYIKKKWNTNSVGLKPIYTVFQ